MSSTRLVIGPNASMDVRGAWWFLGSLSAVALAVALFCTYHGFWPVLPFAGAELAAVGAAVWVSLRRNRYREVLVIGERRLVVEFGMLGSGPVSRVDLPRSWVRVQIETGEHRNDPNRLVLSCSGQRVEIGRCLTDDERIGLATRLKELLSVKPVSDRPLATEPGAQPAGKPLGE